MVLSSYERTLAAQIRFDEDVFSLVKEAYIEELEEQSDVSGFEWNLLIFSEGEINDLDEVFLKIHGFPSKREADLIGLSLSLAKNYYQSFLSHLRPKLRSLGYDALLVELDYSDAKFHPVGIFKCKDPFDVIFLLHTEGSAYKVYSKDIFRKLKQWQQISVFEILAANTNWLTLKFLQTPEDLYSFSCEVVQFCP
jgi:hypothetical protein